MSSTNEADLRRRTLDLLKQTRERLSRRLPRGFARQAAGRLASGNVEELILSSGPDDLRGINQSLLSTMHAPWLPVLGLFRADMPEDLSIRALDEAALLPHLMVPKHMKDNEEAMAAARDRTAKALRLRMVARIDLALRRIEGEGHTLAPVETVMRAVRRQISREADLMAGDRENGDGMLSLDMDASPKRADYGLDVDPNDLAAFRPLFVAAVREGMERGCLAGEKRDGVAHLQRMETARAERAIADLVGRSETAPMGPDLTALSLPVIEDPSLSGQQKRALGFLLEKGFGILTGGPGTGKTHTVARLVGHCMGRHDLQVTLAAPTGKAAARMNAMLARSLRGHRAGIPKARTIHSLLEAVPEDPFGYRFSGKTVASGLLIVDECSMVDTHLMKQLVAAIDPERTAVLFVGDPNQIPPVGPGQPFADMVGAVARTHGGAGVLTEVHRQSEGNPVIRLARAMQERLPLELHLRRDADPRDAIVHLDTRDPEIDATAVVACIQESCQANNLDPSYDTMTIAPQYEGKLGVNILNESLKACFNPVRSDSEGFLIGASGSRIDVGDRVIMTRRNLVHEGVMNGDTGILLSLDCPYTDRRTGATSRGVMIDMGSRDAPDPRTIRFEDASSLELGYAITAHRAQGDEAPLVTVVCEARNRSMLNRNLIYTAVTRTRDHLITVGNADLVEEQCHTPAPARICRMPGLLARRVVPDAGKTAAHRVAAPPTMPGNEHLHTRGSHTPVMARAAEAGPVAMQPG